jgi:hypothetical protein
MSGPTRPPLPLPDDPASLLSNPYTLAAAHSRTPRHPPPRRQMPAMTLHKFTFLAHMPSRLHNCTETSLGRVFSRSAFDAHHVLSSNTCRVCACLLISRDRHISHTATCFSLCEGCRARARRSERGRQSWTVKSPGGAHLILRYAPSSVSLPGANPHSPRFPHPVSPSLLCIESPLQPRAHRARGRRCQDSRGAPRSSSQLSTGRPCRVMTVPRGYRMQFVPLSRSTQCSCNAEDRRECRLF